MAREKRKIRHLPNDIVTGMTRKGEAAIYFTDVSKTDQERALEVFKEIETAEVEHRDQENEGTNYARVGGLLQMGVDFSVTKDGRTLCETAILLEKPKALELLLLHNANPDETNAAGHTLLMQVSEHYGVNAYEMTQLLIDAAARFETKGPEGKTALELAFWRSCYSVSLKLWINGANADRITGPHNIGPCLDKAIENSNEILMPKLLHAILQTRADAAAACEKKRAEIEQHGISLPEPIEGLGQIQVQSRRKINP